MPSKKVIERAYDAELKKMLGLIAVWASFFIGLVGILVALIGRSTSVGLLVRTLLVCLAAALAVLDACLTMAILSKFQELVFLEKQPQISLTSFYAYLDDQKIRFSGARWWDGIVRKRILLVSDEDLRRVEQYDYRRMGERLNALMYGIWGVLFFLWISVFVASAAPSDLMITNQVSPSASSLASSDWIQIFLGFLATLLGVIFAFQLERWRDGKSRKERLIGAIEMIKHEVEKNVGLCKQIQNEITQDSNFVQYYNLKTTTWEGVSSALVDMTSRELSKRIASEYYEYYHMNRKLDARLVHWGASPERHTQPLIPQIEIATQFGELTKAILHGAQTLYESGGSLLTAIIEETDRLRDC